MKLYKLTDANGQTRGGTQWGEGISHSGTGEGELCSAGWIHAYTDPLLAIFLNPIHGDFSDPQLWEAEGVVEKDDHGLKVGCRRLTAVKRLEIPPVTREDRVRFAILCSLEVYDEPSYVAWAHGWLSNEDRSAASRSAAWRPAASALKSAAAWSAESAARSAAKTIDLIAIAKKAVDNSRI